MLPLQTRVELYATDDQILEFERRCALSEHLMAITLARRVERLKAKEAEPFIQDWFRTVRSMAIANHITSGIRLEAFVVPESHPCAPDEPGDQAETPRPYAPLSLDEPSITPQP
jgi:hypothetical protein